MNTLARARDMSARGLAPIQVSSARTRPDSDPGRTVFWIVLAAVLSQLTVSSNLLTAIGIPYNTAGGLPLEKFHIGTYLAGLAVLMQASRHGRPLAHLLAEMRRRPRFPIAAALMFACAVYALLTAGTSGSAVYIETYVSAACLGFALEDMAPADLRRLGIAMIAAFALNALISTAETGLQFRVVPVEIFDLHGKLIPIDLFPEFRGNALYDNPLTGAMMTMMGVFLCLASDLRPVLKTVTLALLLIGLMPFGGRTAIVVTYAFVVVLGVVHGLRALLHRRVGAGGVAIGLVGVVVAPAILAALLFGTPLGDRIVTHFYADDSANIRILQWSALDLLRPGEALFGMNEPRLIDVMLRIGLNPPLNDIENFWLLVFLNLGLAGFTLWLAGFAVIARRLWLAGGVLPRLILISLLIVASASNSLGRKSNLLFVCVAAVLSAASFARPPPPARGPRRDGVSLGTGGAPRVRLRRPSEAVSAHALPEE